MSIEFFGEDEDFYNPYGSDEDEDEGGKTRGIESKSKPKAEPRKQPLFLNGPVTARRTEELNKERRTGKTSKLIWPPAHGV